MKSRKEGVVQRHLLPGETIVSYYRALATSASGYWPILTDMRLLFVGPRTAEDMHLNSVSSMSLGRRRRFGGGMLALGILGLLAGFLGFAVSLALGGLLFVLGVVAILVWALMWRDLVVVYGGGRQLEIMGPASSLDEFMREVRLQQQRFASYERQTPPGPGGEQTGG